MGRESNRNKLFHSYFPRCKSVKHKR